MATFSPETCLELVAMLTGQQVEREYVYFGGVEELPTKDKRYKIREYLVSLTQATPVYSTAVTGQPDSSNTPVYSTAVTGQPDSSNTTPPGADPQLRALHRLCQEINCNVLELKVEFADWLGQGDGGSYDAVDMDLSDCNVSDCNESDCNEQQLKVEDCSETEHTVAVQENVQLENGLTERLSGGAQTHPPRGGPVSQRGPCEGGGAVSQRGPCEGGGAVSQRGTPLRDRAPLRGGRGGGTLNNRPSNGGQYTSYNYPARGGGSGGGGAPPRGRGQTKTSGGGGGSGGGGAPPRGKSRGSRFSNRGSQPGPRRDFGVRGLGNKEEIPHDLQPIDWSNVSLVKIHKVFYNENSATASRSKEEIDKWRENHKMTANECPNPILRFEEVSFPNAIKQVIRQAGFEQPTPIQAQGWPIALQGRDMIGIAQTGSGKTLGFTLPGLIHINAQPPGNESGPIALCLCPTRELAQQVMGVCQEYSRAMRIRAVCLYGGSSKYHQTRQLADGVEFAIATPGRLIDLLNTKCVSLRRCSYLVLDEADRMLDMGFEPQITAIISQIRPDRQTLMWSATWPTEVQDLAANFLRDPVQITIGSDRLVANHAIKQVVQVIEGFEKFDKLKLLLEQIAEQGQDNKTLVFTDTKRMADDIAAELKGHSWAVESMHGDKRQEERERILYDFKKGYISILVATDVASRGIDISDITNVINFDYPNTSEDYVHRIGRTARASRKGTAYTFITPNDSRNIDDLVEVLREADQEVPHALMMMRECFGGSKPEKKVWVPKSAKRRAEAQTREAERKRLAQSAPSEKPMYAWDVDKEDSTGLYYKEDSDTDIEVRKRQNWPETDDDWAALYGDMEQDTPPNQDKQDTPPNQDKQDTRPNQDKQDTPPNQDKQDTRPNG